MYLLFKKDYKLFNYFEGVDDELPEWYMFSSPLLESNMVHYHLFSKSVFDKNYTSQFDGYFQYSSRIKCVEELKSISIDIFRYDLVNHPTISIYTKYSELFSYSHNVYRQYLLLNNNDKWDIYYADGQIEPFHNLCHYADGQIDTYVEDKFWNRFDINLCDLYQKFYGVDY